MNILSKSLNSWADVKKDEEHYSPPVQVRVYINVRKIPASIVKIQRTAKTIFEEVSSQFSISSMKRKTMYCTIIKCDNLYFDRRSKANCP